MNDLLPLIYKLNIKDTKARFPFTFILHVKLRPKQFFIKLDPPCCKLLWTLFDIEELFLLFFLFQCSKESSTYFPINFSFPFFGFVSVERENEEKNLPNFRLYRTYIQGQTEVISSATNYN